MMNEESVIKYKDLFEFWIPEEYYSLIEANKLNIFNEIVVRYYE